MIKRIVLYSLLFTSLLSVSAYAGTDDETAYALNTLLFLVSGFLVTVSYTHLTLPTKRIV